MQVRAEHMTDKAHDDMGKVLKSSQHGLSAPVQLSGARVEEADAPESAVQHPASAYGHDSSLFPPRSQGAKKHSSIILSDLHMGRMRRCMLGLRTRRALSRANEAHLPRTSAGSQLGRNCGSPSRALELASVRLYAHFLYICSRPCNGGTA